LTVKADANPPKEIERAGVFRLPWVDVMSRYESALVYALPDDVVAHVEALRRSLGVEAPPEFQLEPHLTVLFLGHMDGTQLLALWQCLHQHRGATTEVGLQNLGTFRSGSRVTNIHIRVAPGAEILALHERVRQACSQFRWFAPGPYVGSGYTPHISVFDGIDIAGDSLDLPSPPWTAGLEVTCCDLHMIAKQLG